MEECRLGGETREQEPFVIQPWPYGGESETELALVGLHGLLRQALPVLEKAEEFPLSYRQEMAKKCRKALEPAKEGREIPNTEAGSEEDNYEPGSLLEVEAR